MEFLSEYSFDDERSANYESWWYVRALKMAFKRIKKKEGLYCL